MNAWQLLAKLKVAFIQKNMSSSSKMCLPLMNQTLLRFMPSTGMEVSPRNTEKEKVMDGAMVINSTVLGRVDLSLIQ